MKQSDITIISAIDGGYIEKFLASYSTWRHFKEGLCNFPIRIVYDSSTLSTSGPRMKKVEKLCGEHVDFKFIPFDGQYSSQREKMLTALTLESAKIETPWYLKIDSDTVATNNKQWIDEEWFESANDLPPAFITNPWSYTKPARFISDLQSWSESHPVLSKYPKLEWDVDPDAKRFYCKRIISWLFFGNTAWTKEAVSYAGGSKLPVPSQDTYLWYCAMKTGREYKTVSMKRNGWGHLGRKDRKVVKDYCQKLVNGEM